MELRKSLEFLMELEHNNNRNWFKENEKKYKAAKSTYEDFLNILIPRLKELDPSIDVENAKACMFRIFRDVRFSKDKEPYKKNFGAFIARGGRKSPFAGYYIHMQPEESFLGGGVYMPQGPYLSAIRKSIFNDPQGFKDIIFDTEFKNTFGEVYGEKLKTAPRGYPRDFPDIDLIRNKHYAVTHKVKNDFWLKGDPIKKAIAVFQKQYTFNEYLNRIIEKV